MLDKLQADDQGGKKEGKIILDDDERVFYWCNYDCFSGSKYL